MFGLGGNGWISGFPIPATSCEVLRYRTVFHGIDGSERVGVPGREAQAFATIDKGSPRSRVFFMRSPADHSVTPSAAVAVPAPLEGLLAGLRLGLGPGAGDPEADAETLSRVADWRAVAKLARRHRVAPLFLQGMGARADLLSASGLEPELKRVRDRYVRLGLTQIADLKRAIDLLDAGGIPCLVLKGLSIGQRLYGAPLARGARDIDLLVSPRTFHAAERLLLENGWRRIEPDFPETPARNRWYGRFRHEHLLAGPGGLLELHRRLSYNPFYFDAPFENLHAGSVRTRIGGLSFRSLGEEDEFAYLMCHGARHYWKSLIWLCDVAAILVSMSMEPERFERVSARCRRDGLESIFASTLLLCREAFHVRIPRGPVPLPSDGRRAAWIAGFSRRTWGDDGTARLRGGFDWGGQKLIGLIAKPDLRTVAYEIVSVAVGPRDWGRFNLPDWLFYLYFPLRPLLWLIRKKDGRTRGKRKARSRSPKRPAGERLSFPAVREGKRTEAGGSGTDRTGDSSVGVTGRKEPLVMRDATVGATASDASAGGERACSMKAPEAASLRLGAFVKAVRGFVRAPVASKAMALEGALFLLLARLLVKYVPMRHWRHRLATAEEPAPAGEAPADSDVAFSPRDPQAPQSAGGHLPQAPESEAPAGARQPGRAAPVGCAPALRLPRRAAHIVRRVARHVPFPAVCLPQAMALQWMLRRRGIGSRLIFGARRKANGTGLDFHAWLTVGGKCVIGGGELETYTEIPPFDGDVSRPGCTSR